MHSTAAMSATQTLRSARVRDSLAPSSASESWANGHVGSAKSQSPSQSAAPVLCAAPVREQRLLHVPHHHQQPQQKPVLQQSELVETQLCRDAQSTRLPSSSSAGGLEPEPDGAAIVARHADHQSVQQPATEGSGVARGARGGPHARHAGQQEQLLVNSAAAPLEPPYRCPPADRQSNNHCEATPTGLAAPPPLPPRAGKFELQLTSMFLRSNFTDLLVSASLVNYSYLFSFYIN